MRNLSTFLAVLSLAVSVLADADDSDYGYGRVKVQSVIEARKRPALPDDLRKPGGDEAGDSGTAPAPAKPADVVAAAPRSIIYFGASWCIPCRANKPTLAALRRSGWRIIDYDPAASANIFLAEDRPDLCQRFGVTALPTWVVFDGPREASRHVGVLSPDDVRKVFAAKPAGFRAPQGSDSGTLIEQLMRYAGPSGTFVFTPQQPITATMDGVTVTYSQLQGSYQITAGAAAITLSEPLPRADGKILGLIHYGAKILGGDYQPPDATIRTTLGKYRLKLEPAK